MEISEELVQKIKEFLGQDGRDLFLKYKSEYGRIDPVIFTGKIPHPVHFREGMQVRNAMRRSGKCDDWADHDFDNHWVEVVELAIK